MPVQKTCLVCSRRFNTVPSKAAKAKTCSRECRSKLESAEITCHSCGKVSRKPRSITTTYGRNNPEGYDYCSMECYNKTRVKLVEKPCVICGAQFSVEQYRAERITVCSKECQKKNRWRLGKLLRKTVTKVCPICLEEFSGRKSVVEPRTFCSSKCYGDWLVQTEARKGENNSAYRDGSTPEVHKRVRSRGWNRLADSIREQRGNSCEVCGVRGNKHRFPVHHIIPWIISQDNSPENLLVVCKKCHPRLDYLYYTEGLTPYRSVQL